MPDRVPAPCLGAERTPARNVLELRFAAHAVIGSIQSLRGLAAFAVVICHAFPEWAYSYSLGRLGVEVFFVLSGFIMAHAWGRSDRFALRRIIRIYPIYWLIAGAVGLAIFIRPELSNASPDYLQAMLLLPVRSENAILAVAWTLSHEMAFYALLSLVPRKNGLGIACGVIAGLFLAGLVLRPSGVWAEVLTAPINLCFVLGIAVAKARPIPFSPSLFVVSLAVLTAQIAFKAPADDLAYRGIWFGFAAAALITSVLEMPKRDRWTEELGNASYSLYLIHLPVMQACIVAAGIVGLGRPHPVVLIVMSVAAGLAAYHMAEKPMLRFLQGALLGHRPRPRAA